MSSHLIYSIFWLFILIFQQRAPQSECPLLGAGNYNEQKGTVTPVVRRMLTVMQIAVAFFDKHVKMVT
jgi:hypothetical protein